MIGSHQFTWGEIKAKLEEAKIELQDDDTIEMGFEDEEDYGDAHSDACYYFKVIRPRLETDAELAIREESYKKQIASQKLVRKISYEQAKKTYENLKEEFEHEFKKDERVYFYDDDNKYHEGIIFKIENDKVVITNAEHNVFQGINLNKLTLLK